MDAGFIELLRLTAQYLDDTGQPVRAEAVRQAIGLIEAAEKERDGLAQWECKTCGARFPKKVIPVELDGVTQCSKCVEVEVIADQRDSALARVKEVEEMVPLLLASEARVKELEEQLAKQSISIEVYQQDWIPGFAAFCYDGTLDENAKAHVVLNLGSLLGAAIETESLPDLPYQIAECLMHEVVHVLEAWAGVEFNENRVHELIGKYQVAIGRLTQEQIDAEEADVCRWKKSGDEYVSGCGCGASVPATVPIQRWNMCPVCMAKIEVEAELDQTNALLELAKDNQCHDGCAYKAVSDAMEGDGK